MTAFAETEEFARAKEPERTATAPPAATATFLLIFAYDYTTFLIAALGVGISGGSFAVGVAYVSKWYDQKHQQQRAQRVGQIMHALAKLNDDDLA